jgi:NADPH2:quinone reductase
MSMRSYWMVAGESDARIELRDAPVPEPGPKQLLVRVRAAGLNRGEFIIGGLTKAGSAKPLGIEGAGEVVKVGAQVTRFAPGARVMGRFPGAIAEYVLADEALTLPVQDPLTWEEAGALPTTFMVAHDMLMLQGGLKAGGWLLVTGVTSGVDASGGAGVNLVVNNVGGTVFAECVRCLAFEGRLATVGYVDNVLKAEIDLQALHAKRLVLFGVSQKMTSPAQKAEGTRLFAEQILPLVAAGKLRPLIDRVFPFAEVPAARAHMEANAHVGKIVIAA